MEMDKSQDFVLTTDSTEPKTLLTQTTKPVPAAPLQQLELEELLDGLAEIIEAEGGILTP